MSPGSLTEPEVLKFTKHAFAVLNIERRTKTAEVGKSVADVDPDTQKSSKMEKEVDKVEDLCVLVIKHEKNNSQLDGTLSKSTEE